MIRKLLDFVTFRCRHSHVSLPFTSASAGDYERHTDWEPVSNSKSMSHYVVCLDCGQKFGYDWSNMKVKWN